MKEISRADGIKDFTDLDYIYVDKTEYIYTLVKKYKRVFFSRPRRFGKSLTLNTIGTLFEKGVEPYFKDTWIYDKWTLGQFPVLKLNFMGYSRTEVTEFKRSLCMEIRKFADSLELKNYLDDHEPNNLIKNLLDALHKEDRQIVMLIDEYDHQLTANISEPKLYEEFGQCLRLFYGAIKGNEQIRFLAVTGVTRLKDVSVLSAGSDIEDLSYAHAYSQMIGFTRDEIKRFYGDYLRLGVSYEQGINPEEVSEARVDEFLDRMAYHYDGYCFDEKGRDKVFSTWSVNHFLQALKEDEEVEFGDYWYDVAGLPSVLKNYLDSHSLDLTPFQQEKITVSFEEFRSPTSLITMHPCVLMYQSGYLTLKAPLKRNLDVTLGFANREVSSALCSLISMKFLKHNVSPYLPGSSTDYVLEKGTALQIIDHLNTLLAAVAYDHYPIKEESMLRLLFEFYCKGAELEVRAEQHNSKGRSDLIVVCKERCLVLELKFSQDGSDAQALLDEAIEQIKARDYGREETLHGQMLLRIAAVFNAAAKERRITLWQELSES